jgi:hypothetical protein
VEYKVIKLGANIKDNEKMLNNISKDGWILINVVQIDFNGTQSTSKAIHGYLYRIKKDSRVIKG